MIKNIFIAGLMFAMAGCMTHGDVTMQPVKPVINQAWNNKTFAYEIFYSQPEPGLLNKGKQLPLKPLAESKLSVGAAASLQKFPEYLKNQLPYEAHIGNMDDYDYKVIVKLIAHNKKGSTYTDYEFGKSLVKGIVTLGFGSDDYNIVADFDVTYQLVDKTGNTLFQKSYKVKDSIDHEESQLRQFASMDGYRMRMLEKHLILTLHDFFTNAMNADTQ